MYVKVSEFPKKGNEEVYVYVYSRVRITDHETSHNSSRTTLKDQN